MNPKKFLTWGGLILIIVGILGFIGVIGPTAEESIFGTSWWFDNGENWAHLIVGVVGLLVGLKGSMSSQRTLTLIVGVVAVLIGLFSIFKSNFLGANLENPADTILHLVVGIWALLASKNKGAMPMGGGGMM